MAYGKAGFKTYHKWQSEELKEYVGSEGFQVVGAALIKGKPLSEYVLVGKRSDNVRILIIGAGVLGSNLAHSMRKGNDITILARGRTYQNLKNGGLVIKHKLGKKTTDCFTVIDKLQTDDIYDAIFVVSRFSSLDSIVPMIKCNKSKISCL